MCIPPDVRTLSVRSPSGRHWLPESSRRAACEWHVPLMHRPIHSSMSSVADHGGGDNTGAEGAGEPPGGEEEVDEELEEKMRRYPEDFQVSRQGTCLRIECTTVVQTVLR